MLFMDRREYQGWDLDMIAGSILAEIKSLPKELRCPEALGPNDVVYWHEAGHAAMALAFNCVVDAYNLEGIIKWSSTHIKFYSDSGNPVENEPNGSFVSYRGSTATESDKRLIAAAGVASELVKLSSIRSLTAEQEEDRRLGGYKSIFEIQEAGETIASRFEHDLDRLYRFVLNRMAQGKGFDDLNILIISGLKITDIFADYK